MSFFLMPIPCLPHVTTTPRCSTSCLLQLQLPFEPEQNVISPKEHFSATPHTLELTDLATGVCGLTLLVYEALRY